MRLANPISSARELTGWPGPGGGGGAGGGQVEFSTRASTSAGGIVRRRAARSCNFADTGFNDRAQSMVDPRRAPGSLCEDANFGGYCQAFGPGRYANLGRADGAAELDPAGRSPAAPGGGGWGGGSRAILYEGPNFSGRTFVINNEVVANLDGTGFNDRASSLRVEGGYWMFCSDANFNGECQTFGPGRLPVRCPGTQQPDLVGPAHHAARTRTTRRRTGQRD